MQRSLPRGRQKALTKDGMYSKACNRIKAYFSCKNMKNSMGLTKKDTEFILNSFHPGPCSLPAVS